jgi:hypothetical protein
LAGRGLSKEVTTLGYFAMMVIINMALQKATSQMLYKINGNIKKELQKVA